MPEQLGRIERLEAERFRRGKKLYLIPLVYSGEGMPDEYRQRSSHYWRQVLEQLANLASRIGRVRRVYHESIFQSGEEGMKAMKKLSPGSYQIAKTQCDDGAILEALEERDLLEEVMDWQRCLTLGFVSDKVARKITECYVEATSKRSKFMADKISETLRDDEAGLLFIREGHGVQFPADIEIFTIFPPALDELHRWLRDQARLMPEKPSEEGKEEPGAEAEEVDKETAKGTAEELKE